MRRKHRHSLFVVRNEWALLRRHGEEGEFWRVLRTLVKELLRVYRRDI